MRFILFFNALLLLTTTSDAQNLVANPSFENYSSTYCGIMSNQFGSIINDWYSPTGGTPDAYFTNINKTCFNFQINSQYSGPIGIKGNQEPRTGNVMAAIGVYTIPTLNQREYIQVQLSAPLQVGESYVVEFYASLADSIESSINNLGLHLSTTAISGGGTTPLSTYTPQVISNGFVDNITDWVKISDTIVATSAYQYITIGNFLDDAATNTQSNPTSSGGIGAYGAYYFIDDVRVEKISNIITSVDRVSNTKLEELKVYPNPTNGTLYIEQSEANAATVQVFHLNGQLAKQLEINEAKSTIELDELNNGAYMLRVVTANEVSTIPFVLAR